jgi:hypothetical protein
VRKRRANGFVIANARLAAHGDAHYPQRHERFDLTEEAGGERVLRRAIGKDTDIMSAAGLLAGKIEDMAE